MFSPRWKKEAKLLYKGARKFLNYKRDLLEEAILSSLTPSLACELQPSLDKARRQVFAQQFKTLSTASGRATECRATTRDGVIQLIVKGARSQSQCTDAQRG